MKITLQIERLSISIEEDDRSQGNTSETPPWILEASKAWNDGFTAKEIAETLGVLLEDRYSAATEWLNRLRLGHPHLFPYRRDQQKRKS